jgi:hypothetical protein
MTAKKAGRGITLPVFNSALPTTLVLGLMACMMRFATTSTMLGLMGMVRPPATLEGMLFFLASVMGFFLVMGCSTARMVLLKRRMGLLKVMVSSMKMLGHYLIPLDFEHKKSGPQNPKVPSRREHNINHVDYYIRYH